MIPRTGIIAGAGPLAGALAAADPDAVVIGGFGGAPERAAFTAGMDRLGALFSACHAHGVREFLVAGRLALPRDFLPRPGDTQAALTARIAALKSHDPDSAGFLETLVDGVIKDRAGTLAAFVAALEAKGHEVLGPLDVAPAMRLAPGLYWGRKPTVAERESAISGLDVLAGLNGRLTATAVVANGAEVLGIETAQGLDHMLAGLGTGGRAAGSVLALAGAPGQDLRLDTPCLSPASVDLMARAGLAGVFVASGSVAVVARYEVHARIERLGLFLDAR